MTKKILETSIAVYLLVLMLIAIFYSVKLAICIWLFMFLAVNIFKRFEYTRPMFADYVLTELRSKFLYGGRTTIYKNVNTSENRAYYIKYGLDKLMNKIAEDHKAVISNDGHILHIKINGKEAELWSKEEGFGKIELNFNPLPDE